MPHLAEEMWHALGHNTLLCDEPWPEAEASLLVADSVTLAIQVNGKLRGTVDMPAGTDQAATTWQLIDRLCNICVRWLTRRDRCAVLSAETLETAR